MRRAVSPLFLIGILLLMPWSGVTPTEHHALEESSADWDAAEAATRWAGAIAEPAGSVPLSVGSGQLWVQPGTFDPLFESSPEMDAALVDDFDWSRTGVIIVQLQQRDGEHMASLAASVGATVLDGLPEDAWVLRLPAGDANHGLSIVEQLAADDQVRWIGAQQPGWRLAADLHPLVDTTGLALDLDLTPAGDLSELDLLELEIHLTATGAEAVRCDAWLCQVRGIDSAWLGPLALDGRLLFTDAHFDISLLNDYARSISRIDAMTVAMPGLNGSGEVAALSDSGLDSDHGDFDNRVRQIYHNFGPDNSASDMNSGHGTHVSASMLGDGSGAGSTRGVAPGATFHFYQLEHDASGNLARWGSLYDMFRHSWQANARVQSNSWGAQLAGGDYTSDSRSADAFAHDYEDFLILFAAGNEGSQGSGSVAPPSTGKNVLTVGASTTGRAGTPASGQIASFSSIGPTDDGRIKPDIVAPGVSICSARAWEASAPGPSCSSARHSDGTTPLYMSADGTSSSTPIVGGAALLARQFLREQLGINQPHAALVKALLINRASDLGTSDIPNADEGWGQLDLEQSLDPTSGLISLNTFQDTTQSLTPGYAYVYTYDLDVSYGLDVTLTWMDAEGSASAAQSAPRLMNDLDLVVIAPDGTEYKGNDFANGLSTTGGTKDALNNVERVRLDSGAAGNWSIRVEHAGGASQSYAIVIQAVGNENPMADLSVIDGSIWVSQEAPLENDYVVVRGAWVNQAPATTPAYRVVLEDTTTGTEFYNDTRDPLPGGSADSVLITHPFSLTGVHNLRLRLDVDGDVVELNDETSGVDNNVADLAINVTAIGVRITPHMADGSMPVTDEDKDAAKLRTLDPRTGSAVTFDLTLANEGTSDEEVQLTVTPVQFVRPSDGILDAPADEWTKVLSDAGSWQLTAAGGANDTTQTTLTLTDIDADPNDPMGARYALPGTHVVDVTASYRMTPSVSHTVRLTIIVERVEGMSTVLAGTSGLGAVPGDFAAFSLSVLNTGNGETTFQVGCETPDRWQVEIGDGNSSSIEFEPLGRLQFLAIQVRVHIPAVVDGLPAAGETQAVSCTTSSLADASVTSVESATVEVWESRQYRTELFDGDGAPLGPLALIEDIAVLNGERVNHTLELENLGNVAFDLTVRASPEAATWALLLTAGEASDARVITVSLEPGEVVPILVEVLVPGSVNFGDSNQINFRTELSASDFQQNRTRLLVEERVELELEMAESQTIEAALGQFSSTPVTVKNTGNVDLLLEWSFGSLPEGWSAGYLSNPPTTLMMNRESSVTLSLFVPAGTPAGPDGTLSVLIDATTLDGSQTLQEVGMVGIVVKETAWVAVSWDEENLYDVESGDTRTGVLTVENRGNAPCAVDLAEEVPEGWTLELERTQFNQLAPGASEAIGYTISAVDPNPGIHDLWVNASISAGDTVSQTTETTAMPVSGQKITGPSGLYGFLESLGIPTWGIAIIAFVFVSAALGGILVMRRSGASGLSAGEELLSPGERVGAADDRRAAAFDIGEKESDTSGAVSAEELAEAMADSMPTPGGLAPLPALPTLPGMVPAGMPPAASTLPAGMPPAPAAAPPAAAFQGPPLPPGGLPAGWTMEQWAHYGAEYRQRMGLD